MTVDMMKMCDIGPNLLEQPLEVRRRRPIPDALPERGPTGLNACARGGESILKAWREVIRIDRGPVLWMGHAEGNHGMPTVFQSSSQRKNMGRVPTSRIKK